MKFVVVCVIFALATLNVDGGHIPDPPMSTMNPVETYNGAFAEYKNEYTRIFNDFDGKVSQALHVSSRNPNDDVFRQLGTIIAGCTKQGVGIAFEMIKRERDSMIELFSNIKAGWVTIKSCSSEYGPTRHPVDYARCTSSTVWKVFEGGLISQLETVTAIIRDLLRAVPELLSTCTGQR